VGLEARVAVSPAGNFQRTVVADLVRAMRPQLLALGAADERELDELDAMARQHLDNPGVVAVTHGRFPRLGPQADRRVKSCFSHAALRELRRSRNQTNAQPPSDTHHTSCA
jgi:hypothetical protein